MSIANPSALWFLILAALPIAIHLISLFWQRKRPFPWIALLIQTKPEGKRWRRITEWLILAMRTIAVAALVLAFTKPELGRAGGDVFVDASASMEPYSSYLEIAGATYFAARSWKGWKGTVGQRAEPMYVLSGSKGYLISDFQAENWRGIKAKSMKPVIVPETEGGNVAIISGVPETPAPLGAFRLDLIVRNYSDKPQTRSLTVSDGKKSLLSLMLEIPPQSDTLISERVEISPGTLGLIAISEPADIFAFDDTLYIPVASAPDVECELLSDNPFLRAALFPAGYPSPIKHAPGAPLVVVVGEPIPGKKGLAFLPDSPSPIRWERFQNARVLNGKATIKRGILFGEGDPLLTDDNGRPIAVRWGDWVLVGFNPVPEVTDLIFKGDFPVLVWKWVLSLGEAPIAEARLVGEMINPGPGDGFITGPEGRLARRGFSPSKAGFYTLIEGGRVKRLFAVNADRAESDPKRLSREEITECFGAEPVSLENFLRERGNLVNLAPWLIFIAIALLALEGAWLGARGRKI